MRCKVHSVSTGILGSAFGDRMRRKVRLRGGALAERAAPGAGALRAGANAVEAMGTTGSMSVADAVMWTLM